MITAKDGYYQINIPYNLKDEFKARVPAKHRGWNQDARCWTVSREGIAIAQAFLESHFGKIEIPPLEESSAIAATIQKTFTVEYIGQCKERDGGIISALASVHGFWSLEFPEEVLKVWFERRVSKDGLQTFYQALCVFETSTDQEIKSAYRRLSRQWHPDVCQNEEVNPGETFRKLTDAYEVLRDSTKRRRYDAGLFFERESKRSQLEPGLDLGLSYSHRRALKSFHFRAPLRCGLITAEGVQRLSRFTASKIIAWDDITDGDGRVMTASWNKHTESIEIKWI
jgi:hypothetical protein